MRKRLSDNLYLFLSLALELQQKGEWVEPPTVQLASDWYSMPTTWKAIVAPAKTAKGRKRRVTQMAWQTMVRPLRAYYNREKVREEEGEEGEEEE